MLTLSLVIAAFTMIAMSLSGLLIARSVSRPIAYTMDILKDVSDGNLTRQVSVSSKDEVGDLARYLNFTIDKIKILVSVIKKEADTLSITGSELASNMTQTAAAINQITATIQSITSQTGNQVKSVKSTDAIIRQVLDNINTLNNRIQKQTSLVTQSSSAVEEMLKNIQNVTESLVSGEKNIKDLTEASERGRTGLQEVSSDIKEIARESAGLFKINAVMENIASQTNLLSMNAAIEVAHAGEAGKGFAVVAGEIHKLAESSSAQSKTISNVLKKIKNSIDKITSSTDVVLLKFESITEGVKQVTGRESGIRNVMEEQGRRSKHILEAINNLKEITNDVINDAYTMSGRSKESESLERITGEIRTGMEEMASGAQQINTAITKLITLV